MSSESCSQCDHCQSQNYVASRLDTWLTAHATISNQVWPSGEEVLYSPHDVLLLARFLDSGGDSA